ncbi:hypothetical protein AB3662_28020 [Sorangium cellulosum]
MLASRGGDAERLDASRRGVQVRCGLVPGREAHAATLCAPGGGHE